MLGDGALGGGHVDGEVLVAGAGDPAGAGAARDEVVHRVRGLEADRGAAGAAEGLEQLLDDLVGAVGRPDVGGGQREVSGGAAQIGGQFGAQFDRVPVGVAVESAGGLPDPLGDPLDERFGQGVRVLVGVEVDGDVQLGRPVGGLAAQFVAYGQVVDVRHSPGTSPRTPVRTAVSSRNAP